MSVIVACITAFLLFFSGNAYAADCVKCHTDVNKNIVKDWQMSKHSENDVSCEDCHGDGHTKADDSHKTLIPTPETCADCHEDQVNQFSKGKHAMAWAALKSMPTTHGAPGELIDGMKGCGGCHKIGLKSDEDIKQLKADGHGYGLASCDACHTRHTFSLKEARQPQACQTCHMGFDHPQWEMYSSSKHGVRYLLKQNGTLPEETIAPTCQTCHMQEGNHEVRTAWGFLAVRLPMPEDPEWAADRATILMALGVLDPEGKPTARLEVVKAADVARLDQESWQKERDKMVNTCSDCHSEKFAIGELEKGDQMIRKADHLMAEAINVVADLYKDKILEKPESYAYPFPDLLTFHDAPRPIEQRLHKMFLKHRMRTFQGTFHASPDYALWYGWAEMVQDVSDIKEAALVIRERS
ncbi:MAG: cytochrome C [Calditrichaeota bacterium]|jgi:hypothetical protein|nr:cytochrome C [Calditrichota bacterium]MBT7788323.1 cytochrome C [Calditrichota bacterium]